MNPPPDNAQLAKEVPLPTGWTWALTAERVDPEKPALVTIHIELRNPHGTTTAHAPIAFDMYGWKGVVERATTLREKATP